MVVLRSRIFCVRLNIEPYNHTPYQKAACLWLKLPYTSVRVANDREPKCMLLHVLSAGCGWPYPRLRRSTAKSSIGTCFYYLIHLLRVRFNNANAIFVHVIPLPNVSMRALRPLACIPATLDAASCSTPRQCAHVSILRFSSKARPFCLPHAPVLFGICSTHLGVPAFPRLLAFSCIFGRRIRTFGSAQHHC